MGKRRNTTRTPVRKQLGTESFFIKAFSIFRTIIPSKKVGWRSVIVAICIGLIAGIGWTAWVVKDIPSSPELGKEHIEESTKIYDRSGTTILYEFGDVRRTWVPLSEISEHMQHATVAVEDRGFYSHRGLNFRGILRAAVANIRGTRIEGGSSITQQLVKNTVLSPEKTMTRKIREAILAIEIERRFTKDEILEMYLNVIPYGGTAHGVESAAQTMFNTSARDLTLPQAALLASLPQAPTYYSPYGSHTEDLFARKDFILDVMTSEGYISEEERHYAKQTRLEFSPQRDHILAPHFVMYVRELLEEELGETITSRGGLRITTTLDMRLQRAAEDAISAQVEQNKKYNASNAALTAMDPKTGDILAMVGSVNYFDLENDGNVNVAIRMRSPGSSFKPIVYAKALENGYTPETILADVPINFGTEGNPYTPQNYDGGFSGPVTLRDSLARSLNIPAVQALYLAGLHESIELSRRMGITTFQDPDRYGLALVLGGGEVRLLDMVAAYGVFAQEGTYTPHRSILRVEDARGRVIVDYESDTPTSKKALDRQAALQVTDILSDNVARAPTFGTGAPMQLPDRPAAIKTGTAQEFRDGWAIGFTPSIVTGVWVGNNNNTPMHRGPGLYTAAPIWNAFMRNALQGTPTEEFTKPEREEIGKIVLNGKLPEVTMKYDATTNTIFSLECPIPIGRPVTFIEFHSPLWYLARKDPRGDPPKNPESDPMFAKWEAGVSRWREEWNEKNKDADKRYVDTLPEEMCDEDYIAKAPSLIFLHPALETTVRNTPLHIEVAIDSEHPIKLVEFFAREEKIGERSEEPWAMSHTFPSDVQGRTTIRVVVEDEKGRRGQATRTVIVNPDTSPPEVTLLDPRDKQSISLNNFPYRIKTTAVDTSGIYVVDALYQKEGEERPVRIGRQSEPRFPGEDRYEIDWGAPPSEGVYRLWIEATDITGNKTSTTPITIIVNK